MKEKKDLFRFATLRAPQFISKRKRTIGFVKHPSPGDSNFLSGLQDLPDLQTRRSSVRNSTASFIPFRNPEEIKLLFEPLFEFSLWLADNKNNLDRTTLDARIPATLPDMPGVVRLWDNVYYDILEEKNPNVRQACLQMLVAHNFAENYLTYSPNSPIPEESYESVMSDLKRLANAKVLVDEAFSEEKATSGISNGYSQISAPRQIVVHTAKLAALKIPVLKKIKE